MVKKTVGELTEKEIKELRKKVKAYRTSKSLTAQEIINESISYGKHK